MRPATRLAVAVMVSLLALGLMIGCGSSTGNETASGEIPGDGVQRERQPAWIRFYQDPMLVPSAEVRPFDIFVTRLPRNVACTSELRHFLHRARLRFTSPGLATVRVRGRSHPGIT